MVELLPCPFCGGEARRYENDTFGNGVRCAKCGAKVNGFASTGSATRAWNRRTTEKEGAE